MSEHSKKQSDQLRNSLFISLAVGVVFILLRLTNVIGWSWWAVSAPFWSLISHAILAGIVLVLLHGRDQTIVTAFTGIMGIVNVSVIFTVLKALAIINWSWAAVFIPLYVAVGLMLLTAFGFAMARKHGNSQAASNDDANT